MRVPLSWLRSFVPYEGETGVLADRLTMGGLEVEAIHTPAEGMSGVLIGRVVETGRHPNADRLSLCRVSVGGEPFEVVCGAPNVASGQMVAVATVGARLPGGHAISRTKIRGTYSEGMICSEIELGVGEDAAGILVLDASAPIGEDFASWYGLRDEVLDIAVNPNRPDALSIFGIARDVAALFGLPLRPPDFEVTESGPPAAEAIAVEVEDLQGCPRYGARLIRGVRIGPSPHWMAQRLRLAGMRPRNVIVDITNYIMLELGQPQHAFDLAQLPGGRIVVRRARPGERLITLDGVDRELDADMLLITDGRQPIALAGVMGGYDSEITDRTSDILLESACFDPVRVQIAGGRLGLFTESRRRFERGTDPALPGPAADRGAALMAALAGGRVAPGLVDVSAPGAGRPRQIAVSKPRIDRLLGRRIPAGPAHRLLATTGFQVQSGPARGKWSVTVPTWRTDIEGEAHIAEELARLWDYNRLGSDQRLSGQAPRRGDPVRRLGENVRDVLVHLGLWEVLTSSLIDEEAPHPLHPEAEGVQLANPFSSEAGILRRDLLWPVLEALRYNLNRQQHDVRLFEVGPVWHLEQQGVVQQEWVVGALTGARSPEPWSSHNAPLDHTDLTGLLAGLFAALDLDIFRVRPYDGAAFAPGEGMELVTPGSEEVEGDRVIGWAGRLGAEWQERLDVAPAIWIFAFRLEDLAGVPSSSGRFRGLPRYPAADRDLSITLPRSQPVGPVLEHVETMTGVEQVRLGEIYRGSQIDETRQGILLLIRYRSIDKTMTDKDIDKIHQHVLEILTGQYDAVLRG